ncbi:hypothetical protein BH24ACI3_BH24ACI3_16820 [soil metagenome]
MKKILLIAGVVSAVVLTIAGIGGFLYWRSFRDTPQYSLALMVHAAERGDDAAVDQLVDTDAVVEDFVPQVTDKATELYGRGLPPNVVVRLENIATSFMPAIKDQAKAQLPNIIRRETARFNDIPFAAMVVGADRYLDIAIEDDTALIRSKLPEHGFEAVMRRSGDQWQIVGVRDEKLAADIARVIGQQLIAAAKNGDIKQAGRDLGVENIDELLKQVQEMIR